MSRVTNATTIARAVQENRAGADAMFAGLKACSFDGIGITRASYSEEEGRAHAVMADYAAASDPMHDDCPTEVVVDDLSEDMASVRIYSCRWVDFAHVVRARGEWRLFHVIWHGRDAA